MPGRGRALILDMDGVIVDSTRTHTEAWHAYLSRHGISADNIEQRMLGKHNDEIVRDFFPAGGLTGETIAQHGANKEKLYRELIGPRLAERLVPGVTSFLGRWASFPLAVASNAEAANLDFILDTAAIRGYFKVVVNGQDVRRPKPHPDVYLRAAELLGIKPARCIVFEDSHTGVTAARAAGMQVVALTTTLAEFPSAGLVIRDFRDPQLEPWLQQELSAG